MISLEGRLILLGQQ